MLFTSSSLLPLFISSSSPFHLFISLHLFISSSSPASWLSNDVKFGFQLLLNIELSSFLYHIFSSLHLLFISSSLHLLFISSSLHLFISSSSLLHCSVGRFAPLLSLYHFHHLHLTKKFQNFPKKKKKLSSLLFSFSSPSILTLLQTPSKVGLWNGSSSMDPSCLDNSYQINQRRENRSVSFLFIVILFIYFILFSLFSLFIFFIYLLFLFIILLFLIYLFIYYFIYFLFSLSLDSFISSSTNL